MRTSGTLHWNLLFSLCKVVHIKTIKNVVLGIMPQLSITRKNTKTVLPQSVALSNQEKSVHFSLQSLICSTGFQQVTPFFTEIEIYHTKEQIQRWDSYSKIILLGTSASHSCPKPPVKLQHCKLLQESLGFCRI